MSAALYIRWHNDNLPCSPGWHNHPLAKWAAEKYCNFSWIVCHMDGLCKQFYRISSKHHKYEKHLNYYIKYLSDNIGPEWGKGYSKYFSKNKMHFVNCCGSIFRNFYPDQKDIHLCYRAYLLYKYLTQDKSVIKWTKRPAPYWINDASSCGMFKLKTVENTHIFVREDNYTEKDVLQLLHPSILTD